MRHYAKLAPTWRISGYGAEAQAGPMPGFRRIILQVVPLWTLHLESLIKRELLVAERRNLLGEDHSNGSVAGLDTARSWGCSDSTAAGTVLVDRYQYLICAKLPPG